jgi:hypothetical protein
MKVHRRAVAGQSTFAPEAFTTAAHFFDSAAMKRPNSPVSCRPGSRRRRSRRRSDDEGTWR